MKPFKIGIESSGLEPLHLSPFEILDWAVMNEADGVQFSDISGSPENSLDRASLAELAAYADENHLYLEWGGAEHFPFDPETNRPKDISAVNRKAAEQARALGVTTMVTSPPGKVRGGLEPAAREEILAETARSLREQMSFLRDLNVVLALDTGGEFTTFELLRLFESCGASPGGVLGVCLNPLNFLKRLEDPVAALDRILPWIAAARIQDGAVLIDEDGYLVFPVETGTGILDFELVFERLSALERKVRLSVGDRGEEGRVALFDPGTLPLYPDLSAAETVALLRLSQRSQALMDAGRLDVFDSRKWIIGGENRIKRGVRHIRRIVGEGMKQDHGAR